MRELLTQWRCLRGHDWLYAWDAPTFTAHCKRCGKKRTGNADAHHVWRTHTPEQRRIIWGEER